MSFELVSGASSKCSCPKIDRPIPAVTREPKDDYLLAYALVGRADVLVTGDADLLDLAPIEQLHILTARELLSLLDQSSKRMKPR